MDIVELAKSAVENYVKEGKIILPNNNLPEEFLNKKAGTFITIKKQLTTNNKQLTTNNPPTLKLPPSPKQLRRPSRRAGKQQLRGLPRDERKRVLRGLPRDERKRVLRGCIGTYLSTKENIAKEVISNAIAAATEDSRFGPVSKEELPYLSYTVYVLSKPELIKDLKELNPKKYGIIIKNMPIEFFNSTDVVFNGHLPYKSGLLLPDLKGINTPEEQIAIACQKGGIDPEKEKIIIYRFTAEKHQ